MVECTLQYFSIPVLYAGSGHVRGRQRGGRGVYEEDMVEALGPRLIPGALGHQQKFRGTVLQQQQQQRLVGWLLLRHAS